MNSHSTSQADATAAPFDADAKQRFERDGYLIIRGFLGPADLAELNGELSRYIRDVVPTLDAAHAFYDDRARPETLKQMQHMDRDPYFRDYSPRHPQWEATASFLLGEPVRSDSPEWFNKPPRTNHPTPPHQDNYYFNLTPPRVLTIWVALDPVDEENGCLRYIAGSHTAGVRTHGRSQILGFSQGITDYGVADRSREIPVVLQPGDAAVHHGWMIHRADPNRSPDRQRRSFAQVFRGVSCQRDEAGYQRYLANLKQQHAAMGLDAKESP